MKPLKVHMAVAVTVGGAKVPACPSYGYNVTDDWDEVTCSRCKRNRRVIDASNKRLIKWFNELVSLEEPATLAKTAYEGGKR